MRLKEDSSSYRSNAIKRRDFRNDPTEPELKSHSKKDTKRWCIGKVSREHNWTEYYPWHPFDSMDGRLLESPFYKYILLIERYCVACGRKEFTSGKIK